MPSTEQATRELFEQLQPGDQVEIRHQIKVGLKIWYSTTTGTVVSTERRREGLHFKRAVDDKVYSDLVVLRRPDGELTTVAIDEYSEIKRI